MITLIAAMDRNRVIGSGNRIPWRLPDDLARFRQLTSGHRVVMGRRTYESIGRPLPKRENVVISRNPGFQAAGCTVTASLYDAIAGHEPGTVYVIGGAEIYAQALTLAGELELTNVDTAVDGGDAWFPQMSLAEWRLVSETHHPVDERHAFPFWFRTYRRA